jgi:predicted metal-dependent hydrolase
MNDPKLHRYMAYLKNEGFGPKDARLLLSNARQIVEKYDILIRDVRVSNRFIEFDISLGNIEDLEKISSIFSFIGQYIDRYKVVEKDLKIEESLVLAKKLFNEEKYWITHEVLEGVWKKAYGDEKDLLNGLILVAAALVHYQKNEKDIALSIMRRALKKLTTVNEKYFGIDVVSIKSQVSEMVKSSTIRNFTI